MRPRQLRLALLLTLGLLSATPAVVTAKEQPWDPRTLPLPMGWEQIRVVEHTPAVVAQVSKKLGVTFERLTERHISLNGFPLKINIIGCKDEATAKTLHEKMAQTRGGIFFRRKGATVVEAATQAALAARRAWAWLGLTIDTESRWTFEAPVGLVAKHDYMEANVVFNHFLQLEKYPHHGTAGGEIKRLCADWRPGTSIDLLTRKRPWFDATYSLGAGTTKGESGPLTTRYSVKTPAKRLGLHYANLTATVRSQARWTPIQIEGDPGSTQATPHWPAQDKDLKALAERLTKGLTTDRARVLALLRHVGLDVRYSGQTGSRYGTKRVVTQGYGHCWDKSDVLITLARAIGIPARQIAGWVPLIQSGHVWAEVRLRDEGWIGVDATTTWLGTSQDYLPLYATDTGDMPIVYLGWPTVTALTGR